MLELLMLKWEDLLDDLEYKPVHNALKAGIALLEKYYYHADDTDVYFIAHSEWLSLHSEYRPILYSLGSCPQTGIPQCNMGSRVFGQGYEAA